MKKLFAIMVALAAIVAFASCNKNDDNKNSIVGTGWSATQEGNTATIEFTSGTTCKLTEYYEGKSDFRNGTYVYNAPNISISIPSEALNFFGTIDGNKMNLTEEGEVYLVFTKN